MMRLGKVAVATVVGSLLAGIAYYVLDPELGT